MSGALLEEGTSLGSPSMARRALRAAVGRGGRSGPSSGSGLLDGSALPASSVGPAEASSDTWRVGAGDGQRPGGASPLRPETKGCPETDACSDVANPC